VTIVKMDFMGLDYAPIEGKPRDPCSIVRHELKRLTAFDSID
jgi:hypothetical protein